jgi:hypothetical protein
VWTPTEESKVSVSKIWYVGFKEKANTKVPWESATVAGLGMVMAAREN